MGGASGAGGLLLNTKASQEAVCSRAPAAIVSGQEPARGAGMSRFAGNGPHLAGADTAEGHAEQVDGLGSSGNTGNGPTPGDALSPLSQHREGVVQSEGVVEGEAAVAGAA